MRWLTIFGPGAIVASLTIGTGELIFSSRGGALFGYRILFLFLVISLLKWTLLFSTARHMVVSGVHPLRRWLEIPIGPRGWLPAVMFLFAAVCIPIWVSFHCSVLGDLLASLSGTKTAMDGGAAHLWGGMMLAGVSILALRRGYAALERVQITVVALMLLTVSVSLILLQPDWLEMLWGGLIPGPLEYPEWLRHDPRAEMQRIAAQPVWIEASLYVGVIGGAGYDYLAYTSFLRDKRWGLAGCLPGQGMATCDPRTLRRWIRAPLIDCSLSFLVVFAFSAVFVASGWLVLGPQHQIPTEGNFLEHQAQFVTGVHPWLFPLYAVGTLCAMLGTLYGTLEVAPAVLRESFRLLRLDPQTVESESRLRRWGLLWTAGGAALVLICSFVAHWIAPGTSSFRLTTLLIPANLFTGVLSCGIICLLNPWMDRRLPDTLRPGRWLWGLNAIAAIVFILLGIKGYWEFGGLAALGILAGTLAVGCLAAVALRSLLIPAADKSSSGPVNPQAGPPAG